MSTNPDNSTDQTGVYSLPPAADGAGPGEPATAPPAADSAIDLDSPDLYLNRELTWLSFNSRVLHEANDPRNPLLERIKFLAISDNNLDGFVMKRIGGLKQQLAAGVQQTTVDGRTPAEQIRECNAAIRELRAQQEETYTKLLSELDATGIRVMQYTDLTPSQRTRIRDDFVRNILPILTPLAMDPAHAFPFISNLAINLLVTMSYQDDDEIQMARVKVPLVKGLTSRMIAVAENGPAHSFVMLDDVMANNLDLLFPGMQILSCELFRVTRNINVGPNEGTATDLLELIESELRARPFAPIVRLEIDKGMDASHYGMLAAELGLNPDYDVYESQGMLGMRDLFELASLDRPDLKQAPAQPADHPALASDNRNIFHILRESGPLLLQHPYQSFANSVERFLRTASEDPKVVAIKMTLYRTSAEAEIIDLLVNAARNGKQVAVLVELKARFDEAANIDRARSLEEAGVHVTYGVLGLKTHSKAILIVRQDFDRLRRYCHIGTGNYHPATARLYSDLGLMTCDDDIGNDLTQLFNYLTGYATPPSYRKLLAAPNALKKPLLKKIDREIQLHEGGSPGHIQFKTNALEDPDITKALYKASRAGVKVDLLVRDSCRFRPGIPGLSESATVISIVGEFLEHSRIYYFHNGGDEEYFLGSADLMRRNLEARVEVVAPVEDPELRQELRLILTAQLSDSRNAWDLCADGSYVQRRSKDGEEQKGCQQQLLLAATKRQAAASMHKEKKVRGKLLNRFKKRLEEYTN